MSLTHFKREEIIWECESVTANEKTLLLALNSFVDGDGECYPGQARLAKMCCLTDRTIRNLLVTLEGREIVQRSRRNTKRGHRTSDKYRINFLKLKNSPRPTGNPRQPDPPENESLLENDDTSYRKTTTDPTGNGFQGSIQMIYPDDLSRSIVPSGEDDQTEPVVKKEEIIHGVVVISVPKLIQQMVDSYNSGVPACWSKVRTLSPGRESKLKGLIKQYGKDEALQIWEDAIAFIKHDDWWSNPVEPRTGKPKKHDFETLFTKDHITSFRDKYLDSQSPAEFSVDSSSDKEITQQILAILDQLGMTVVLPPNVQEATGCTRLAELSTEHKKRYLTGLQKKLDERGAA